MQVDHVCSFKCFWTRIRPLRCCTENRDSFEKTSCCHSYTQFCHWVPLCAAVSKEASTMVSGKTVHAPLDLVALSVSELVVLQTNPLLDSRLYDTARST
ncbi:hypothetical protein TNCV_259441 [Trichonephila clavipes]|uniref:Uncharacterized protein n=1 Tax=Trichonephila clavipes TaxID=2585209 RepID=A0A8X6RVJ4_TRICX|nr:hypothetical protein TNCV_259441 [Trichonephila clavipes]